MSASQPDPRAFDDVLRQALAVLAGASPDVWLTAPQIAQVLGNEFGLRVHWRTIHTTLSSERTLADRRKRGGHWQFTIMGPGRSIIARAAEPIVFVDPARAVTAILSLHAFLGALKHPIRACDPYMDVSTLEHLDACPAGVEIRLLTKNVTDSGPLRRVLVAAGQNRKLEVRIAGSGALHDRYIIDPATLLILGTSLNGFGKKQCFVIKAGRDIRDVVEKAFDALWAAAKPWP